MRENVSSGYRVPTTRWSGYYFSHTSPNPLKLNENDGMTTVYKKILHALSRTYNKAGKGNLLLNHLISHTPHYRGDIVC